MLSSFTNLYFPICSLTIMILLLFLFLSKKNADNDETHLYFKLIITGFFEALLYSYICTVAHFIDVESSLLFYKILNKILYLVYIIWFSLLYNYEINISFKDNQKKIADRFMYALYFIEFIISIGIVVFPVEIYFDATTGLSNSYGLSANALFVGIALYIISMIIVGVLNLKTPEKKKYMPLFLLIFLMIITMVIRIIDPLFSIYSNVLSLVTLIMFFTIENPDLKLIEELTKAQKLSEKSANEKSNFLYNVTEEINGKLDNIEKIYKVINDANSIEEIKSYNDELKDIVNNSRKMLKQTIDISEIDIKHLKVINNKYNIRLLLESIYNLKSQNINENIEFRLNIDTELPNELYGDSIKLKQIISSIIDNAIKNTKQGFIELKVSSIIKNSICRLIIILEDTGSGIDIYKQNKIMSNSGEMTINDINSLDNLDLNLNTIRKMINVIGGTFNIDTNKYNGTDITITLDQKIVENIKSNEEQNIDKYSKIIKEQKSAAIVSQNKDDIKIIKNLLSKHKYKVEIFDSTKKLLDLLRNDETFNLIFIDEFMEKIDARSFINKIQTLIYKSKIYVLSNNLSLKNQEEMKKLGFELLIQSPIRKKDLINKINL